jgi:hypothetical protein
MALASQQTLAGAMRSVRLPLVLLSALVAAACSREPSAYRGEGLEVAPLPVHDRVAIYRAALGGSFGLDHPYLSLLVDPVFLPRVPGLIGGDSMPSALLSALRGDGVVLGMCTVPVKYLKSPLICRAERDGYVVRLSDLFALGPDSVQVHVVVQQYVTPHGRPAERLRFERAYHVARSGSTWRPVREARLSQP